MGAFHLVRYFSGQVDDWPPRTDSFQMKHAEASFEEVNIGSINALQVQLEPQGCKASGAGIKALSDSGCFDDVKEGDDKIYTISVSDFATIALEILRGREATAEAKRNVMMNAGLNFIEFLEQNRL